MNWGRLSKAQGRYCDEMDPTMAQRLRVAISRIKRRLIDGLGTVMAAALRVQAKRRQPVDGITVVTANWYTLPFLQVLVETVAARSPVVDNASTDGSREYLASRPDIRTIRLPVNVRHGRALDIGVACVQTETVVVLDVDAFPITDGWLSASLDQLADGTVLSGAYIHRNYIHPCFLVARTDTIVQNDLSFRPVGTTNAGPRFGVFMDAGEALSQAVVVKFGQQSLHKIEASERFGPGQTQTVFGDVVFHNFQSTYGVGLHTARARFGEAVQRFGLDPTLK